MLYVKQIWQIALWFNINQPLWMLSAHPDARDVGDNQDTAAGCFNAHGLEVDT